MNTFTTDYVYRLAEKRRRESMATHGPGRLTCPHSRAAHDAAWARGECTVCMKDEIATLRTHLADAVAFVRKAGHLPGCGRRKHCAVCNAPPFAFTHSTNRADSHPYKEGPCTCGHDRIVGSEGE